jgi:hypothetical protein
MARTLTKTKKDGSLYERPPEVEREIDEVLPLGITELRQRLAVTDWDADAYLHSETLVHLVRTAILENRQDILSAVLLVLLARCESNLNAKVREGDLPDVESVREEILSQFSEFLATAATAQGNNLLDYYECRFNSAFLAFRISSVRKEVARLKHLDDSEETEDETYEGSSEPPGGLFENLKQSPTQEWETLRAPLVEAIRKLPRDERKAVILVHVLGYQQESQDPNEVTAATRCNCTGKTIYNRLKRAEKKLSSFKEYV